MNFVQRILELCTEREELSVVHDQVGSPTYTPDLAACSVKLLEAGGEGVHHLACAGRASWCELAAEAASLAGMHCRIKPITSDEYPLPAPRPAYSVLDLSRFTELTGVKPRAWATCLRDYVFGDLGYAREDS